MAVAVAEGGIGSGLFFRKMKRLIFPRTEASAAGKRLMLDALAATRDFPGVTGRTTINASRDADKEAAIITVKDGKLVFVETIRP